LALTLARCGPAQILNIGSIRLAANDDPLPPLAETQPEPPLSRGSSHSGAAQGLPEIRQRRRSSAVAGGSMSGATLPASRAGSVLIEAMRAGLRQAVPEDEEDSAGPATIRAASLTVLSLAAAARLLPGAPSPAVTGSGARGTASGGVTSTAVQASRFYGRGRPPT
jgi:hypothetical protein